MQLPLQKRKTPMAKDTRLVVRCTEQQREMAKEKAAEYGLNYSELILTLVSGFEPKPRPNIEFVKTLAQLNADMNRFGNLLKMWIVRDHRLFGSYTQEQIDNEIMPKLMEKIDGILLELREVLDVHLNKKV